MDSRRRRICLRQLETLRKIEELFCELRSSSLPLLEDSTLLVTQESRDEVLTRFEELYAITDVPHTVKKRNRDVFPSRGWCRPDEAPIEERIKFADRDEKRIERYKTEKDLREKAADVLNSACCSKKNCFNNSRTRRVRQTEKHRYEGIGQNCAARVNSNQLRLLVHT